jgi:CTP-dependent riboflavin kinase
MMTETITTTKIRNGHTVLAKTDRHGVSAKQFTNRTQAIAAAARLQAQGHTCEVVGHRPFYVALED